MASALNPKTVMVTFLRDFLKITEDENIAKIKVFEKLQDSYGIISKYEAELASLLCEQGISPPLFSSPLQNNLKTDEIIAKNLTYLTGCTGNWPELKVRLRSKSLLSGSEIQILDSIPDDKSRFYKMYEWIAKKPGCINDLINCLNNSNNAHIVEAIREAQLLWIKNKTTLNKAFWNQMEENMTEYENNSILVRYATTSNRICNEKSEISVEIVKLEAEKRLLKSQLDELLEKLIAARQSEAEVRRRLEIPLEIEKPQLTEELNRLLRNIQGLNTEKTKLESELRECQTIINNQNAKLEDLEKQHNEGLGQLALAENNKLELEKQILKMNSDYELERKSNYDIIGSVKLENMFQIRDLKKQLGVLEADNKEVNAEVLTLRSSIERLTVQSLSTRENRNTEKENWGQESGQSANVQDVRQLMPANARESVESTNVDNISLETINLTNDGGASQESIDSVIFEHICQLSLESSNVDNVIQEPLESTNVGDISQELIRQATEDVSQEFSVSDSAEDVNAESTEAADVEVVTLDSTESADAEDVSHDNDAFGEVINEPEPTRKVEGRVLDVAESVTAEDYNFVFSGENNDVFQQPESGFHHKVLSITIDSCKIDAEALKNSLRRCTKLRSLRLLNVEMMNIAAMFRITIDLPSLESLTIFIENQQPHIPSRDKYGLIIRDMFLSKADIHFVHNGEIFLYKNKQKGELVFNRLDDYPTSYLVSSQLESLNLKALALYECSFSLNPISLTLTELVILNCTISNLKQLLGKMSSLRRFKYIDYEPKSHRSFDINWLPECLEELSIHREIDSPSLIYSFFRLLPPVFLNLHTLYLS